MISRFLVELTEPLCDCPTGNRFALDLQISEGVFEVQIACESCNTQLTTPVSKIKALISVTNNFNKLHINTTSVDGTKKANRPKLILIQGGAATSPIESKHASVEEGNEG